MNLSDIKLPCILEEIAQDEQEKFNTFRDQIISLCNDDKMTVTDIYRLLIKMEIELKDYLKNRIPINIDKVIIKKVLKLIKSEIFIIKFKMKKPNEKNLNSILKPVGSWTGKKIDIIALIYAMKTFINHGTVSVKSLQKWFEYMLNIKLDNIYDRFRELEERKNTDEGYFKRFENNLTTLIEEYRY